MSVKRALEKARRPRVPVLPIEAIFAYALLGAELLLLLYFLTSWPRDFHPRSYHGIFEFWVDGYVLSRSVPEMLLLVNFLVVAFLWCAWRGWVASHPRRGRSTRGAALAFLVPALAIAMVSWGFFLWIDLPRAGAITT